MCGVSHNPNVHVQYTVIIIVIMECIIVFYYVFTTNSRAAPKLFMGG